jgi:hypothetical protein
VDTPPEVSKRMAWLPADLQCGVREVTLLLSVIECRLRSNLEFVTWPPRWTLARRAPLNLPTLGSRLGVRIGIIGFGRNLHPKRVEWAVQAADYIEIAVGGLRVDQLHRSVVAQLG